MFPFLKYSCWILFIILLYLFNYCNRVAKRWMHSQLFSGHFQGELVELIVSFLFNSPLSPYNKPLSTGSGFVRYAIAFLCVLCVVRCCWLLILLQYRFLRLLATFDWDNTPLVVEYDTIRENDWKEINVRTNLGLMPKPLLFGLFLSFQSSPRSLPALSSRPALVSGPTQPSSPAIPYTNKLKKTHTLQQANFRAHLAKKTSSGMFVASSLDFTSEWTLSGPSKSVCETT